MKVIRATVAVLALMLPPRAFAEIKVCNEFALPVLVAIGWDQDGAITTKGWWQVNTGRCVVVDPRPLRSPHYVRVETKWRSDGRGHTIQNSWGKGRTLLVSPNDFTFVRAQAIRPNDHRADFDDVGGKVTGAKNLTYVIKADGRKSEKQYR